MRTVAAVIVGVGCLLILAVHAATGVRSTRTWADHRHIALAASIDARASCLGRAIDAVVPPKAQVHVPLTEAQGLDQPVLAHLVIDHLYRRAVLVERARADLVVAVAQVPGAGCGGYAVTARPPDG